MLLLQFVMSFSIREISLSLQEAIVQVAGKRNLTAYRTYPSMNLVLVVIIVIAITTAANMNFDLA